MYYKIQIEIKESFQRNAVTIDGILYNVYILKDASTVDNYKIYFI